MNARGIIFDLDGTLIDSRADLAFSINLMLADLRLRQLDSKRVVEFVGEGTRRLVERALNESLHRPPEEAEVNSGLESFNSHYDRHLLGKTKLYPSVRKTLDLLAGIRLAVVTNKASVYSERILEGLGIAPRFSVVLGGDSLTEKKPSPAPLLKAAEKLRVKRNECLMVGDSRIDIAAGISAGMVTCGCAFGFRGRAELEEAGADIIIDQFSEVADLVQRAPQTNRTAPRFM